MYLVLGHLPSYHHSLGGSEQITRRERAHTEFSLCADLTASSCDFQHYYWHWPFTERVVSGAG